MLSLESEYGADNFDCTVHTCNGVCMNTEASYQKTKESCATLKTNEFVMAEDYMNHSSLGQIRRHLLSSTDILLSLDTFS